MRVIKKSKDKQIECECGAILEYVTEDINTGEFGCAYITCPECKLRIHLVNEIGKTITIDNIIFPQDFTEHGKGIDIDDSRINGWIKECLRCLEDDDIDYGLGVEAGSGNTMVFAKKYGDEYVVWVTRDYCTTSVPR